MNDFQFYPTPPALAAKAWGMFTSKDVRRLLEPSAGNGDLLGPVLSKWSSHHRGDYDIDCCELDVSRHAALKSMGVSVIGTDFLAMTSGAIYSHILMNPPFADGAKHVLKAWGLLWDGEVVAILNAETIRNPFSLERQQLARLIEAHGDVEFVADAFVSPETMRKTEVEVALVHLTKRADVSKDIYGDLLTGLREDRAEEGLGHDFHDQQQVALPNTVIENQVLAFRAAVQSMQEAVKYEARARYYSSLLGETMAVLNGKTGSSKRDGSVGFVQGEMAGRYRELKDKAWASIIRSANVLDRLSSQAQKRVESEFEQIKRLEFTESNIYGFLLGLANAQGELQLQMACDVFDEITRYHTDNAVFYRGWKSNDKHRTCGRRIRTTRFILPHMRHGYGAGMEWETERRLADFDKVFAMLDGKREAETSMVSVIRRNHASLLAASRLQSDYFEIRYFKGTGTIHFFPTDKKLVDRLNRLVGRHRGWLPPEGERVSDAFWLQYEKAEKLDAEVRKTVARTKQRGWWRDPFWAMTTSDEGEAAAAQAAVDDSLRDVHKANGISTEYLLTNSRPVQAGLLELMGD